MPVPADSVTDSGAVLCLCCGRWCRIVSVLRKVVPYCVCAAEGGAVLCLCCGRWCRIVCVLRKVVPYCVCAAEGGAVLCVCCGRWCRIVSVLRKSCIDSLLNARPHYEVAWE